MHFLASLALAYCLTQTSPPEIPAFTGRVVDSSGDAIAGGKVTLEQMRPTGHSQRSKSLEKDGTFEFDIPDSDFATVRIEAPGFLPFVWSGANLSLFPHPIVLEPGATLRLIVLATAGVDAPKQFEILPPTGPYPHPRLPEKKFPVDGKSIVFEGLRPGRCRFRIVAVDLEEICFPTPNQVAELSAGEVSEVEVTLPTRAHPAEIFIHGPDGEPIAGAYPWWNEVDVSASLEESDASGVIRKEWSPYSANGWTVTPPWNYLPRVVPLGFWVVAGVTHDRVDIELEAAGGLNLTVLDVDGTALNRSVVVRLESPNGMPFEPASDAIIAGGSGAVGWLPTGNIQLQVHELLPEPEPDGLMSFSPRPSRAGKLLGRFRLDIEAGKMSNYTFRLPPAVKVSGSLLVNGIPPAGGQLELRDGRVVAPIHARGTFHIASNRVIQRLQYRAPNGVAHPLPVDDSALAAAEANRADSQLTLQLNCVTAPVAGRVRIPKGYPLPDRVELDDIHGSGYYSAPVAANGHFVFHAVVAGVYHASGSVPRIFECLPKVVVVAPSSDPSAPKTIEVDLEWAPFRPVAVRVSDRSAGDIADLREMLENGSSGGSFLTDGASSFFVEEISGDGYAVLPRCDGVLYWYSWHARTETRMPPGSAKVGWTRLSAEDSVAEMEFFDAGGVRLCRFERDERVWLEPTFSTSFPKSLLNLSVQFGDRLVQAMLLPYGEYIVKRTRFGKASAIPLEIDGTRIVDLRRLIDTHIHRGS